MPKACGLAVGVLFTNCGQTIGLYTAVVFTHKAGGNIPHLFQALYHFCTQFLHTSFAIFTPVILTLPTLSTAPTIMTTNYIKENS